MNTITPKISVNKEKSERVIKRNPHINNTQSSYSPSFKAIYPSLINEADKKIFNIFAQHYGNVGERLGLKVGKLVNDKSTILRKSSRFILDEGVSSIKPKSFFTSLCENLLFPFTTLPLYAASWVLKKAQNIPALKSKAAKLYNKPLLRVPRKINELGEKTDMLKGMYDKTSEIVAKFAKEKKFKSTEELLNILNNADDNPQFQQTIKEANEYIKENLYKVSNKFFDKHTGNYNTAYERPLNRIVSGLIPVMFLANDAYNLSVLCGDTKEMSKKEARERRKQEISRVFTTAYIQLLTFGAFTKEVNTIPWFTPLTSAMTVLFSEITSRSRIHKPIFFLNKEKAKEYNRKMQTNKKDTEPPQIKLDYKETEENTPKIFTSFKGAEKTEKPKEQESSKASDKTENKEKDSQKVLINMSTFKKLIFAAWSGALLVSIIKNSSFTKNSKPVLLIKKFGEFCSNKIYKPLAFKDFEISNERFETIMNNLKEAGCEKIAEGHEFIKNKYGKQTANGIIKMYKSKLSSADKAAKQAMQDISETASEITPDKLKAITDSIKSAIKLEQTSIAENKFSNIAKKAAEILKNKKVELTKEEAEIINTSIVKALENNAEQSVIQIETKLKPFVDIVTQPFKFILSGIKLPFNIFKGMVNIAVSPIEKKAAQEVLGLAQLTDFEKAIHKVVLEVFGEQKAKSGKISQTIFVNAIEQLDKHTQPFRKAEAAYQQALKSGSETAIKEAKEVYEAAKKKLLIYVNTAVEKSFNGVTQSSNKNTDLALMSKLASSAVTSAFLVADNYNMVMIKSNGEDKEGAKEKANERIIQRLSALFYQSLFINWFNATFRTTYNSSLKGMAAVVIPNTLTTEIVTRKSIGMPIGKKTYEQLQAIDEKNEKRTGFVGKYFKFMRLLTGKKPLKNRLPKNKTEEKPSIIPLSISESNTDTTNILNMFLKQ